MATTPNIAASPSSSPSRCDSKVRAKQGNAEACPLFMDGLPSHFAQNSALAAIASLIDDDASGEECKDARKKGSQSSTFDYKSGGGKVKKTGKRSNHSPYSKEKGTRNNGGKISTTLGEAQLFLNMWKI
ncbi:hypothetical protein ACHAW5_004065 [Stephanodiscus triporus]|uniref:Uncharacterized protein n=1 Tax=Stephanodiscus triporus TaxID=2934178 RepID=A0ABD3PQK1_9STRA